ncbi:hypothetical protein [Pseudopedobacter sp.]|uniref:hypothetical protein n=1 Tax=Pseudopedobacter sp. TaxID=1936787 RepID=UPI00333F6BE8
MPEDQSYEGSEWNRQMCNLLKFFKWEYVGDSDFDAPTEENKQRGIDRLFTFKNPYRGEKELCILESKRYKKTSFSEGKIGEWAKTLEEKLTKIRHSKEFYELFPHLDGMSFDQGLVAIWCPDKELVTGFNQVFLKGLENTDLNPKHSKSMNKLYFFDNNKISKLVSVAHTVKEINTGGLKRDFNFYYHGNKDYASCRSEVLLPMYMIGKFILGDYIDKDNVENKVVFYFGTLNIPSFKLLRSALSDLSYTDKDKPLQIYYSIEDNNHTFRKILPEIEKDYNDLNVKFLPLDSFDKIPAFLNTDN